ncbi:Cytotoxic and regulatory T-cell molecule [Collichthys lucidus]|uniref:Cytotoxic and regulatory T-cell molecule n=1 Tax=Collichthys lucidus TaxID=240159 RepID=A0A4U5V7W9_COLLU|nr:Cytotoxic and regulatory T-cell molecule [Collichthys lucidus]
MEPKLQLIVFMLLVRGSFAVQRREIVKQGQTITLTCPRRNVQDTIEWKNPGGFVMFIKLSGVGKVRRGVQDKRYSLVKLTQFEFTVSVSDATFKDGGVYTCSHDSVISHRVEVTVLGLPKIRKTKHEGRFDIKCTAEGSGSPPQIFWKLDHGPEILAYYSVTREDKEFISVSLIHIQSVKRKTTVTCLVRHPALHSDTLMDFVKIGKNLHTTTSHLPTTPPPGSTEVTTTGWFKHDSTTVFLSAPTSRPFSSNEPQQTVAATTGFPMNNVTSTSSHLSTSDNSSTSELPGSTRGINDTISNATTDWTSITETTEITSHNHTERNVTGSLNDPDKQIKKGGSSLLVVLVSFLIFCLLVVVMFFAIKLRRAHLAWKRGIFNTAFTQYVVEQSPAITSVVNTAAMATAETVNEVQSSQPDTAAKCSVKETEL